MSIQAHDVVPSQPPALRPVGRSSSTPNGRRAAAQPAPTRSRQQGGMPEWLMVVLVLVFIFAVLPLLTPLFMAVYVALH